MIAAGSLWQLIELRAEATPDALFAIDERDRRLSFSQYRAAAERCAAGLAAQGLGTGDAVSWQLPTWLESLVLVGALARLGVRQNPILPIYREREVGFVVEQSQPRLLVVPGTWRDLDYEAMASDARAGAGLARELDVLVVDRALPESDPSQLPEVESPADPAERPAPVRWLFYTSGTTADPKGVLHTDASLLAVATAMAERLALAADDKVALVFPLTHIGGIGWLFAGLLVGCAHIVIERFDPKSSIEVLARNGVTQGTAGTAFHQAYLEAQRGQPGAPLFPAIRAFPGDGAPKPPQLHFDLEQELGGVGIVSGYGMTECPIISMNSVNDADEKLARTEGRATRGGQIKVVKLAGGPAGAGEEGELRVKGPQLCRGYLDASLNEDAFDDAGYFKSGDLGYLDEDGYVVITGRSKDIIIRKGENISAKEVEDLLYQHPKVTDTAVIGLPDPASGERCCAVVACIPSEEPLGFAEMTAFLKESGLMIQKIPEQLEIVSEIPRNPTGKILKEELRKKFGA